MSKDKRAEIVEAMARELLGRVNAPEQEIYRVAGDLADIAIKAAAEIALDALTYAEFCAYEKRQSGRDDNKECAEAQMAWRIRDAILAITSEGEQP